MFISFTNIVAPSEMPSYDAIIPVLMKEGIDELPNHCKLTPGTEQSQLAQFSHQKNISFRRRLNCIVFYRCASAAHVGSPD